MSYVNRQGQEDFLRKRGIESLMGKRGMLVPLNKVPDKQLYAVFMKEVEKLRKEQAKPAKTHVRDEQRVWAFAK
jgi:hypothetical protein